MVRKPPTETSTTKSNMNQKAYSILFCALLASTFVTELRAKGLDHHQHNRHHKVAHDRAVNEQECSWVCTPSGGTLRFIVNVSANLVAIFDIQFNVAIVIDINANLVAVFNGNTGIAIVINLSTNIGVYITVQVSSLVWLRSRVDFGAYFASLSLTVFFNISGAIQFDVKKAPSVVQEALVAILVRLVFGISIDVSESFNFLINISVSYIQIFRTSLRGGLAIFGSGAIAISGNIAAFLQILVSFSNVINLSGGIDVIIRAGIRFNFSVLFAVSSGVQFLVNIIQQISVKIDISSQFGVALNKAEYLFAFLAQSGGSGSGNITGIFKIASSIIGVIDQSANASIHKVIDYLIQYAVSVNTDVGGFYDSLEGFSKIVEANANLRAQLSGLISIVAALRARSFIYKGVNISAIIELLIQGAGRGASYSLVLIVSVLFQLKSVISEGQSSATLLFILIVYSNTAAGVEILKQLGIIIVVSGALRFNLLISIFAGFNFVAFLLGNFYSAISGSGIGVIAIAVSKAVQVASNGALDFAKLLNAQANVIALIKGLIQAVTGFSLGVSAGVRAEASQALEAVAGAKGALAASFSFGFSASVGGSGGAVISLG